jgi:DNA-binding IclR family transcriptional regulator
VSGARVVLALYCALPVGAPGGLTPQELAPVVGVHHRSVQRHLRLLESHRLVEVDAGKKPYRWRRLP